MSYFFLTKVLTFEISRLALRQKLKLQDSRPSKCFLDVFTSISCFLSMMSGKGRVGYYSSRNSSLTLGAMQAVHWWSFVCSSLLVVLLRKLRRECSLSGPSAGITGMYWWNLSNGLIIYINQWHYIQNKQSMWWCGLKRNSQDSPCHGTGKCKRAKLPSTVLIAFRDPLEIKFLICTGLGRQIFKFILKMITDGEALVQCSLDGFRVLSLNFGGKWKKLAETRSPETPTFRMYGWWWWWRWATLM